MSMESCSVWMLQGVMHQLIMCFLGYFVISINHTGMLQLFPHFTIHFPFFQSMSKITLLTFNMKPYLSISVFIVNVMGFFFYKSAVVF